MQPSTNINDLVTLMARLRAECPWDIKQTNESLIPYMLEEAYELVEAIQSNNIEEIQGELGDVLLQVVFHACIYAEKNEFDLGGVIYTLMEKLIRRHPHVFKKDELSVDGVLDDAAVKKQWDLIKQQENAGKTMRRLAQVKAGSGLMQAQALQKQASKFGFDWEGVEDAQAKLQEELDELQEAITANKQGADNKEHIQEELGDCLFGMVNVARKLGVDSETAMQNTIHKFRTRFAYIEDELEKQNIDMQEATLEQMDVLWEQAKKELRK